MYTFDNPAGGIPGSVYDATGVFLIGQLERLDPNLYEPLIDFTWSRDITLRTDVTMADDVASWMYSNYAKVGGVNPNGISWIGQGVDLISGVALDAGKKSQDIHTWGMELKWSVIELAKSQQLGRPVDAQQYDAMQMGYNADVNQLVYVGDTSINTTGMCNGSDVSNFSNVANGVTTGAAKWAAKNEREILADVNEILFSTWQASGYKILPTELRLPPSQFSMLTTRLIGEAGSQSVGRFLAENNIVAQQGGTLNIQPLNYLIGRGTGGTPFVPGTDRMMAYSNRNDLIRFPLVPLQRTPLQPKSIYQTTTYYGKLGSVEFLRPETVAYRDGI
jgi:hypothetical protein